MKLAVVLVALLGACIAHAQNPLPLQQGNMWEYRSSDPFDPYRLRMKVVGDTIMPNSKTYVVLSGSIFTSPFLRLDSSRVYAYSVSEATEYRLFDFLATPGDTIARIGGGTDAIVFRSTWIDTTSNDRYWDFAVYRGFPPVMYEFIAWHIRENRGVVYLRGEPGLSWSLIGARINGDTIGQLTSVTTNDAAVPEQPVLTQNYPNPFNPTTNIKFQIPRNSFVTLRVFDLLGREIATLVNEQLAPGTYERTFHAEVLTSGVYFCKLETNGFVQTKKLLLLR